MKILGLDIGSYSVKGLLLSWNLFGFLSILDKVEVPVDETGVEAALRTCYSQFARAGKIVVSLDRREIATRLLELPTQDHEQVRKLAPFQLGGRIPFADEALTDGCPLAALEDNASLSLLCAIRKPDFEKRIKMVTKVTGTDAINYHVDSFGPLNLFLESRIEHAGIEALLDIGASKTLLAIVREGRLLGSRLLLRGMSPGEPVRALTDVLVTELRRLLLSVECTMDSLASISLSGGGAQTPEIASLVSSAAHCEAGLLVHPDISDLPPSFHPAFALALSATRRLPVDIDFHHDQRPHFLLRRSNLINTAIAALLLGGFFYGGLYLEYKNKADILAVLEHDKAVVEAEISRLPLPPGQNADINEAIEKVKQRRSLFKRDTISPYRILLEAAKSLADGKTTMTVMKIEGDRVTVEAETDSFKTADKVKLSLSRSPYFTDIKYDTITNIGPVARKKLRFKLTFRLKHRKRGQGGD